MKERTFVGFDTIKRYISIEQVLARYDLLHRLRRSGEHLYGVCPLHNGHNRGQFRVNLVKNCWICFGDCNRGGSVIDFVSIKEQVSIREAGLLLQQRFGLDPARFPAQPYTISGCAGKRASRLLSTKPNPPIHWRIAELDHCHPFLGARDLSPQVCRTFGVGYCDRGKLAGRIVIPIHNGRGQLVAYASRIVGALPASGGKYRFPKGFAKSLELFNLHRAAGADAAKPLVIVEGFVACMYLWQAGYHRVVAAMGARLSLVQATLIITHAPPQQKVLLLFDEDNAGRAGREQAKRLLQSYLKVIPVSLPKEGMQPDWLPPEQLLAFLSR